MRRYLLIFCLALPFSLMVTGTALANHITDPDPHQRFGFEAANDFEPNFCLQCHDVHTAGDYALIWQRTITNTCASCHGVYQRTPRSPRDPNYPGQETGPAASKTVYKVTNDERGSHEGHRLGLGPMGTASFTYASGPEGTGENAPFTTASADFIPGSGYPSLAGYSYLNRIDRWANFVAGNDMSAFLAGRRQASGGLYCASCHSVHGWLRGSALPGGITNNKLLVTRPNQSSLPMDTSGWKRWYTGGWRFCAGCHQQRTQNSIAAASDGPHNHPEQFCLDCHANNPGTASDFPHSGAINLLADYPDQLCIASCHAFDLP